MISHRAAALMAVSHFYALSRVACDIEGCNIYLETALRMVPELGAHDEDETWDGNASKGSTMVGVGDPSIRVGVVNRTPMVRVKGT